MDTERTLPDSPAADPATGARLGRFELREPLGEGGMGQVFRAFDPELRREVAIKVLRVEAIAGPHGAAQAHARLKREAQAMARITHPNVVTVYEVGEADERVFIVMELIAGGTLRSWAAARPRTVAEILTVFGQAGAGLAAAHAAALVHRDFKPENVLIDAAGRAHVTDFGLVGATDEPIDPGRSARTGSLAVPLTHTGAVLGTPTYMAPEQHRGEPATAQSDQFGFCVALYEALWAKRPFPGATYRALLAAVLDGDPAPPPSRPRVPARLRHAILRGLARRPDDRFPTMAALLGELDRARGGRRARVIVVAAAALAGGAALAVWAWPGDPAAPRSAPPIANPVSTPVAQPPAPPMRLTDLGGCAEHPMFTDADTVVFDRSFYDSQDLFAVSIRGGVAHRLTTGPNYHWNPRPGPGPGEITYVRKADEHSSAGRLARDHTDLPITGPATFDVGPGLVPIRGGLAYATRDESQIRVFADGADRALVTLPPERLAYGLSASRDGRWLAIDTSRTTGVCLVDTAAPAPQLECRAIERATFNTWFDATAARYYHPTGAGIWRFDRATGAGARVSDLVVAGEITVSPDERTLVYSDCSQRARLLDMSSGAPVELAAGVISAAAVGPADRIVFRQTTNRGQVLVVREPDGSTREITSPELGLPGKPAWDPAGQRVVFSVSGKGLHVVDATPSAPARLTDVATDVGPRFLDDHRVVFTRLDGQRHPSVWIVAATGGAPARALDASRWAWDVDRATGRVLLSDVTNTHFSWWDPTTHDERAVPAIDAIAGDGLVFGDIAIAPDGSAVYVTDQAELHQSTWRVPLHGGKSTRVFTVKDPYDALDRPVPLAHGVAVMAQFWAGELYRVELPAP